MVTVTVGRILALAPVTLVGGEEVPMHDLSRPAQLILLLLVGLCHGFRLFAMRDFTPAALGDLSRDLALTAIAIHFVRARN